MQMQHGRLAFDWEFLLTVQQSQDDYGRTLVNIINNILFARSWPVKKFTLQISYEDPQPQQSDIDRWCLFLSRNGVEELNICLDSNDYPQPQLPFCLLSCRTIKELIVRGPTIDLPVNACGAGANAGRNSARPHPPVPASRRGVCGPAVTGIVGGKEKTCLVELASPGEGGGWAGDFLTVLKDERKLACAISRCQRLEYRGSLRGLIIIINLKFCKVVRRDWIDFVINAGRGLGGAIVGGWELKQLSSFCENSTPQSSQTPGTRSVRRRFAA
nr:F-box/FBD/LRR-repeat protein At1g13570-like [Ipomoea batatas]